MAFALSCPCFTQAYFIREVGKARIQKKPTADFHYIELIYHVHTSGSDGVKEKDEIFRKKR